MKRERDDETWQQRLEKRQPGEGTAPSLEIEIDARAGVIRVQDPRFFNIERRAAGMGLLNALCQQPGIRKAEIDSTSSTCRVEFDLSHHAPQFMANAFVQAIRQSSAASASEERTPWWGGKRQWSRLTAYRYRADVILWETDEARSGHIRHRHQGGPRDHALLKNLADRLSASQGVQACRFSRWSRTITIDCRPGHPGAGLILDRTERILESSWVADSRRRQLMSVLEPPEAVKSEPIASGWKRLTYLAMAGGAFTLTLVGLVVPGVPTVPFLLATSFYLARSSPRLDGMLRDAAFFGPILREWESQSGLSVTSKAKLIALTATIVIVTVLIAPLTPLALGVILLFSSLSVLGIASMPALTSEAHGVGGQTLLTLPAL